MCVLHDCDHVHSWLWRYLPGYPYWKVCSFVVRNIKIYFDIFRLFQILFLVVGLAMFTTVIPEAMVLVGTRRKFGGVYKNERGKTFIVVSKLCSRNLVPINVM